MKLTITKNYEELSQLAAMELLQAIYKGQAERTNIAITAGKTPIRMYAIIQDVLVDKYYPHTNYYNFDEIPIIGKTGVTMDALNRLFFEPNAIAKEKIHVYDENNYQGFDEKIHQDGGLDFMMIGLGTDGHFCGNLSGTLTSFDEGSKSVPSDINAQIKDRLIELVGGEEYLTEKYVTFGPKTVMNAKHIVLIVNGSHKAEIFRRLMTENISLELPASILKLHPNLTIIVDQEAAALL